MANAISTEGEWEESLPTVVRRAFEAMRRQLKELVERQRGEVKEHSEWEPVARATGPQDDPSPPIPVLPFK